MSELLVESSAVLRAFVEGDAAVKDRLVAKDARLVTSELTLVECQRTLNRALREGRIPAAQAGTAREFLQDLELAHRIVPATGEIAVRARANFAVEPVRTLDALHLATAFIWNERVGPTPFVSVDRRIRENALAVGIPVLPSEV